jgi:hypothetical protein
MSRTAIRQILGLVEAEATSAQGWQQFESLDMSRTDRAEVTMVEGRKLSLPKTLDDGHHGGVDEPEPEVSVPAEKVTDSDVIGRNKIDDRDGPILHVSEDLGERLRPKPCARQPVQLHEYGSRH